MRFIVTGGFGFIGSHVVEKLTKGNNVVYVVDNSHTGNIKNIKPFIDKIIFYNTSVGDFFSQNIPRVDYVIHLGMPSSSPMYHDNPYLVGKVIEEFMYLLEYCKRRYTKLILISTSSLYNGNSIPYQEDMEILPTDFYTEVRYSMERLAYLYYDYYGVKSIVLRLFSVYGEREEYKGEYANVVTQMMWANIKNKKFLIYGDGEQERDFIYVKDVVNAIIKSIEALQSKKIEFGIFNVCTGKSYSFNNVKSIIESITKKRLKVEYILVPRKNYIREHLGDPRKAKRYLGFKAKTELPRGLEKIYSYYSKVLKNAK